MDALMKILLAGLLFFAPFAFAGAEPWAFSVLQGGIFACLLVFLFKRRSVAVTSLFKPVCFTLGFLTAFALLQSVFAQTILDSPVWYPSTFMRLFTLEHASLFVTYLALTLWISQLAESSRSVHLFSLLITLCGLAVLLCALSFPDGEYIRLLAGRRGGIGPFLNRNHAGLFFAMCAVITAGYASLSFLDYGHFAAHGRKGQFYLRQGFFIVLFVSLCAGCVFTRSRGGMLALSVGIFCYAFLCTGFIPHRFNTRLKGLAVTAVCLLCFAGWVGTHTQEINLFAQRAGGTSEQTRIMLYRAALDMLKERPVWGIGIGALPVAVAPRLERPINQYVERLHSDWLEILLGTGYIGFLPVLAGVIWFIRLAFGRLRRLESRKKWLFSSLLSALLVMAVGSAVDFDFFIPATSFLFFMILGLACSPSYHEGHTRLRTVPPVGCAAVTLIVLAACWIPFQKTAAWRLHLFGRGLTSAPQIAAYEKALSLYPSPRYALYLGNAYYKASLYAPEPQKTVLRAQAYAVAEQYLQTYPQDKELSRLYLRVRGNN